VCVWAIIKRHFNTPQMCLLLCVQNEIFFTHSPLSLPVQKREVSTLPFQPSSFLFTSN
jgi:hypothetical protein